MKTLLAEIILLPILLLAGYALLFSASMAEMQGDGRSAFATYGELMLPLTMVVLVVVQMLMLPTRWPTEMFMRWLVVISIGFAIIAGYLMFIDIYSALICVVLYLFVVGSWLIGFRENANKPNKLP